jgi:hypothetical protein
VGEGEGYRIMNLPPEIKHEGYRNMNLPPEIKHESTRVPAVPFLRDVAHDGCLCTFIIQYVSSWKFRQLAAWQFLSGKPVQYGKDKLYGQSITYKITPAGSLSSSQWGRRVGPAL